jgi:hypothetical protein
MRLAQAWQGPFAHQLTVAPTAAVLHFIKKRRPRRAASRFLSSSNVEKLLNTPILRSVGTAARETWATLEVTPLAGRIVAAKCDGRSRANCGCAVGRDLSAGSNRTVMAMMMRGNMHVVRMRGCLRTRDR